MRCINIKDCSACPNIGHKGAWGEISYIPVCRKENKELPFTTRVSDSVTHRMIYATVKEGIPIWCPLDEFKENK